MTLQVTQIKNNTNHQVEMGRPTQRKGGKKKGNKTIKKKNCDERPILRFSFGDRVECTTKRGWETGTGEFQLFDENDMHIVSIHVDLILVNHVMTFT